MKIRTSDGPFEGFSAHDAEPASGGIEPVEGLWPCQSGETARAKDELRPAPEALRALEEAWRFRNV